MSSEEKVQCLVDSENLNKNKMKKFAQECFEKGALGMFVGGMIGAHVGAIVLHGVKTSFNLAANDPAIVGGAIVTVVASVVLGNVAGTQARWRRGPR